MSEPRAGRFASAPPQRQPSSPTLPRARPRSTPRDPSAATFVRQATEPRRARRRLRPAARSRARAARSSPRQRRAPRRATGPARATRRTSKAGHRARQPGARRGIAPAQPEAGRCPEFPTQRARASRSAPRLQWRARGGHWRGAPRREARNRPAPGPPGSASSRAGLARSAAPLAPPRAKRRAWTQPVG